MGNQQKVSFIVKNFYKFLAVFFVLALAACGSGGSGGGDSAPGTASIEMASSVPSGEQLPQNGTATITATVFDENGKRDPHNTSVFGPYVDKLLIPQLKELSDEYGVDGVWIDGDCWATCQDYAPKVVKAFREAIGPALDAHLQHLGTGTDVLRSRNTGRWKIDGIWSVWLKPDGFHHNHVHPKAWLSSACYIELPDSVAAGGQEGWIKFGEPGVVTRPKLAHEHAVQPEPGMLVLFPSYMWHGTVPFESDEPRMTAPFDVVPT